jgi:hypothetical protein
MLDRELVSALFVGPLIGIGTCERHVEADGDGVAGRRVAEFLCVGALGKDQRRDTGREDAGEAALQHAAAAEALQIGHFVLLMRGGSVHRRHLTAMRPRCDGVQMTAIDC